MRLRTIVAALALASFVGCRKFESGGGSRSVVVGSTAYSAVYGFGEGKKLGFVMFTDISSEGTVASAGSTWTGHIAPTTGQTVEYKGSADRLDINGTEYTFANGRVFLVSTQEDNISVIQLNVPIGDSMYDAEIDRIEKTEDVQGFLAK
jgi:hypothetical protein